MIETHKLFAHKAVITIQATPPYPRGGPASSRRSGMRAPVVRCTTMLHFVPALPCIACMITTAQPLLKHPPALPCLTASHQLQHPVPPPTFTPTQQLSSQHKVNKQRKHSTHTTLHPASPSCCSHSHSMGGSQPMEDAKVQKKPQCVGTSYTPHPTAPNPPHTYGHIPTPPQSPLSTSPHLHVVVIVIKRVVDRPPRPPPPRVLPAARPAPATTPSAAAARARCF